MDYKALTSYFRYSIIDADSGTGIWSRDNLHQGKSKISNTEFSSGVLSDPSNFFKESDDDNPIQVIIYPYIYKCKVEHFERSKNLPTYITPCSIVADLYPSGKLCMTRCPAISRELLDPVGTRFTVGSLDAHDTFISRNSLIIEGNSATWSEGRQYLNKLIDEVANNWSTDKNEYILEKYGLIKAQNSVSEIRNKILSAYDNILSYKESLPLYETFLNANTTKLKAGEKGAEVMTHLELSIARRLGHSNDLYPLANAQRDALACVMDSSNGEILAVNGPPGTGKTTLLLSVIASLWVNAAYEKKEPPIIFATSANNQAITNILDAFGKDFVAGKGAFAGRWLPQIKSYGCYFASDSEKKKTQDKYQTDDFIDKVETQEYWEKAVTAYKQAGANAYGEVLETNKIVERLHADIVNIVAQLSTISPLWDDLDNSKSAVAKIIKQNPSIIISEGRTTTERLNDELKRTAELDDLWSIYIAEEPFIYSFLNWLPFIAAKRSHRIKLYLKKNNFGWISQENYHFAHIDEAIKSHKIVVATINSLMEKEYEAYLSWVTLIQNMDDKVAPDSINTIRDIDALADKTFRFQLFRLATHYWEGQWLLDMEKILPTLVAEKRKQGRKTKLEALKRHMKLTPCIVSTFYKLPSYFVCSVRSKETFIDNYMVNDGDLLIVDEAGQVSPEVAAASFAMFKKALVIGDTEQIEPIWSISENIDIGNLKKCGLIQTKDNYDTFKQKGLSVSSGSVMKVAQNATKYHYDLELAAGLYLYDHRRCYDEIISYCNKLCYKGRLNPLRGSAPASVIYPPMGYVHVDGICEKERSGSRHNKQEAYTIAQWIKENANKIRSKPEIPLGAIIGIVTPFKAQTQKIGMELKNVGLKDEDITVGTIHALQGAEREIIIFSPVYSKHSDGTFIDQSNSMLNVAVSRAKKSFLIFGDMDIFEAANKSTPRGLLAQILFEKEDNEIKINCTYKESKGVELLENAEEHDHFLMATTKEAHKDFILSSPWILPYKGDVQGIVQELYNLAARGVTVKVYTDIGFNTQKYWTNKEELLALQDYMREKGVQLFVVNRLHGKVLICDDKLLCTGSYNWLSAARTGQHANYEVSLVCREDVKEKISAVLNSLVKCIQIQGD